MDPKIGKKINLFPLPCEVGQALSAVFALGCCNQPNVTSDRGLAKLHSHCPHSTWGPDIGWVHGGEGG